VTLNNIQAVLDRNTTFYTKLTAEKVAKLESITAGSLMRVTPRLVDEGEQQRVMLTLNIEDGQQGTSNNNAESLPQINNSEIATQASLLAGQSLLLGGFTRDEQTTGERSIPLLRDIPVLGSLFRSSNKSNRNIVRLFLIKAEPIS
jgi:type III secretion protein C